MLVSLVLALFVGTLIALMSREHRAETIAQPAGFEAAVLDAVDELQSCVWQMASAAGAEGKLDLAQEETGGVEDRAVAALARLSRLPLSSTQQLALKEWEAQWSTRAAAGEFSSLPLSMSLEEAEAFANLTREIRPSTQREAPRRETQGAIFSSAEFGDVLSTGRGGVGRVAGRRDAPALTMIESAGILLGVLVGLALCLRFGARRTATSTVTTNNGDQHTGAPVVRTCQAAEPSIKQRDHSRERMQLDGAVLHTSVSPERNRIQGPAVSVSEDVSLADLAGGLAHELRNPLTSVKLLVQNALNCQTAAGSEAGCTSAEFPSQVECGCAAAGMLHLSSSVGGCSKLEESERRVQLSPEELSLIAAELARMEHTLRDLLDYSRRGPLIAEGMLSTEGLVQPVG